MSRPEDTVNDSVDDISRRPPIRAKRSRYVEVDDAAEFLLYVCIIWDSLFYNISHILVKKSDPPLHCSTLFE